MNISKKKKESRRRQHVRLSSHASCAPRRECRDYVRLRRIYVCSFFTSRQDVSFTLNVSSTLSCATWHLLWRPEQLDLYSGFLSPCELFKIGDDWWLMQVFWFRNFFQLRQTLILTMSNLDPHLNPHLDPPLAPWTLNLITWNELLTLPDPPPLLAYLRWHREPAPLNVRYVRKDCTPSSLNLPVILYIRQHWFLIHSVLEELAMPSKTGFPSALTLRLRPEKIFPLHYPLKLKMKLKTIMSLG